MAGYSEQNLWSLFNWDPANGLDFASLTAINGRMAMATDCLAENTHFRLDWSCPQALAAKLVASNQSDMVAGQAKTVYATLCLGVPAQIPFSFWQDFATALRLELDRRQIRLVGGDCVRAQSMFLQLTLVGKLEQTEGGLAGQPKQDSSSQNKKAMLQAGDNIFLSRPPGMSMIGYQLLKWAFDGELKKQETLSPLVKHLIECELSQLEQTDDVMRKWICDTAKAGFNYHELMPAWMVTALQTHLYPREDTQIWQNGLSKFKQAIDISMDSSDGLFTDLPRLLKRYTAKPESGLALRVSLQNLIAIGFALELPWQYLPFQRGVDHISSASNRQENDSARELFQDLLQLVYHSGEEFGLLFKFNHANEMAGGYRLATVISQKNAIQEPILFDSSEKVAYPQSQIAWATQWAEKQKTAKPFFKHFS